MRKMIGMIIAWTPLSVFVGFVLYNISPTLLFMIMISILVVDIFGWLVWFLVLGYTIAERNDPPNS